MILKYFFTLCILLGIQKILCSQNAFPAYPEVVKNFFSNNDFNPENPSHSLRFAKKKAGWYVNITDWLNNDSLLQEQLLWDAAKNEYKPLEGFDEAPEEKDVAERVEKYLGGYYTEYYSYERCRYYGYNGWSVDMINEFGSKTGLPDTLLEGLARAYSNASNDYLWYQFGGSNSVKTDTMRNPLGRLELPSVERVTMSKKYIDSAVLTFKKLNNRNPSYNTLVGNAAMKVFNETMHGYNQMILGENDQLADEFLKQVEPDKTITAIAKNYLAGCLPNAILITFGDNDTYPLWYMQQTLNYRKDVAVINTSLLGLARWIDILKRKRIVDFSSTTEHYGNNAFDFLRFETPKSVTKSGIIPLKEFIRSIQSQKDKSGDDYSQAITYSSKKLAVPVDLVKFNKHTPQAGLTPGMEINLPDYLTIDQFIILDIINSNFNTRPVYFTSRDGLFSNNLQQEGLIYHLLPLDKKITQPSVVSVQKSESFIASYFTPTFSFSPLSAITAADNFDYNISELFSNICNYYYTKANITLAKKWALKTAALFDKTKVPPHIGLIQTADILFKTAEKEKGLYLLENMSEEVYFKFKNPSAISFYMTREYASYFIEEIRSILEKYDITSERFILVAAKMVEE